MKTGGEEWTENKLQWMARKAVDFRMVKELKSAELMRWVMVESRLVFLVLQM